MASHSFCCMRQSKYQNKPSSFDGCIRVAESGIHSSENHSVRMLKIKGQKSNHSEAHYIILNFCLRQASGSGEAGPNKVVMLFTIMEKNGAVPL